MEPSVIDLPTFAEFREGVGDDFAAELVDTFLDEAPGIFAELRNALGSGDAGGYRRAAHSLKANGNTFGALEFAKMARDAEVAGLTGDAATDAFVVDALDAAYAAASAQLLELSRG